ncbi:MAG: DinB family protein [bacterium]|nr:DinB family protein [bacterium]
MKQLKKNSRIFIILLAAIMMVSANGILLAGPHDGEHKGEKSEKHDKEHAKQDKMKHDKMKHDKMKHGEEHSVAKYFGKNWKNAQAYTLEVAEMMPEEHYTFKPVPEIDSFAGHLAHITSTMYFFGSKIKGVNPPKERPSAEGKSKAEVIDMVKKGFQFATEAINGLTNEEAHKKIHLFGDFHLEKANVVRLMNNHMTHHRGGLVIYLRLKGKKPPQFRGY